MIKDVYIRQVIKDLGLPSETKFVGYVVHLPDSDEFLAMIEENEYLENRAWSKIPDLAKRYKSLDKARKEARRYGKGANACILLDAGEQYVLAATKPTVATP